LSSNVKDVLQTPIIRLDSLDSTNNYAAQLVDAEKAQEGTTIVANHQTAGKGQRDNVWNSRPGESLLMSIVLNPKLALDAQFQFLAAVSVAIQTAIKSFDKDLNIKIKFPNDIIINDKKAAGILIENNIRGNEWLSAIVGVGINVHQSNFGANLPNATSLRLCSQISWSLEDLLFKIRSNIFYYTKSLDRQSFINEYNGILYKRGEFQFFEENGVIFRAKILGVNVDAQLLLLHQNGIVKGYHHGELIWKW
jgi:BirA family biotin operon repressor/biotin-[acetyl-CoA-carboxylase] ligase